MDALPEGPEVAEARAGLRADDDPEVLLDTFDLLQNLNRGLTEVDDLGAGLRVGEAERLGGKVHVLPLERHDLAQTAAGQDQQPHGCDGGGKLDARSVSRNPTCLRSGVRSGG